MDTVPRELRQNHEENTSSFISQERVIFIFIYISRV